MINQRECEVPNLAPINELEVLQRLAFRVRQARRRANWTQPEIARRSGVTLRTYKRFEQNGKGSIETLVKVAYALGRGLAIDVLFQAEPALATMEQRLERLRKLVAERQTSPPANT
jgi:transcriptional regulator with XRE-family HTH domain